VLGAYFFGYPGGADPDKAPEQVELESLVVQAKDLNFGEVWEDSQFKWILHVNNPTAKDVQIDRFFSSCSCLNGVPKSLLIPAGQCRDVELTVDLTEKPSEKPLGERWAFQFSILPTLKTGEGKMVRGTEWVVSGHLRKVVRCDKLAVQFGKHSDRSQPIPPQHINISTVAPVIALEAACSSPDFELVVQKCAATQPMFRIEIKPTAILPTGIFRHNVDVTVTLAGQKKVKARKIILQGEVAADVQALPPQVNLGAEELGTVSRESVTLYSLTNSPFKIVDYQVEGNGLGLVSSSGDDGDTKPTVQVQQRIVTPGEQTGTVVFTIETMEGVRSQLSVAVRYHGIASK
jgi:hypothetical protein